MTSLRIYGVARTRAFRVLWIAKELDLDYEHVPTEIGPAGARKADYLAINPNGRLPAIDDGGFMLWESLAITLYLAKKHGRLYPRTLEGEAKALPAAPTSWARTSPSPISTLPPSSAGRSTWI